MRRVVDCLRSPAVHRGLHGLDVLGPDAAVRLVQRELLELGSDVLACLVERLGAAGVALLIWFLITFARGSL